MQILQTKLWPVWTG